MQKNFANYNCTLLDVAKIKRSAARAMHSVVLSLL